MKCPECGGDSCVISSRPFPDRVMRRRRCVKCGQRWSTGEFHVDRYMSKTVLAILRKFLTGAK
jgi:transcriptional regulator NrdR family protein